MITRRLLIIRRTNKIDSKINNNKIIKMNKYNKYSKNKCLELKAKTIKHF